MTEYLAQAHAKALAVGAISVKVPVVKPWGKPFRTSAVLTEHLSKFAHPYTTTPKARLNKLKTLLDQKLNSQEEYEQKRRKIIDD